MKARTVIPSTVFGEAWQDISVQLREGKEVLILEGASIVCQIVPFTEHQSLARVPSGGNAPAPDSGRAGRADFVSRRDVKIGQYVRLTIKRLLVNGLIEPEEVENLQDKDYCSVTFGVSFPVLKLVGPREDEEEARFVGDRQRYARYYKGPIVGKEGARYLLCSQWYERNRIPYDMWLSNFPQ